MADQPGLAELTPERIDEIVDERRADHNQPPWLEPLAELIAEKVADRLERAHEDRAR